MKRIALPLAFAAMITASLVHAQSSTTTKPATAASKPAVGTAPKAAASAGTAPRAGVAGSPLKLPPGVPPVRGLVKSAFALRYQEIKIGTGPLAESNKLYKVAYTGWLASDGKKFDSSFDHPDKEPIQFPQGRGRVIPGWDQGFEGMKIGGKRRLFIPYQLAYGVMGRPPVIPPKSDLIFDIELVAVDDMPAQAMPGGHPMARPATPTPPPAPTTAPKPADPAGTPNPAATPNGAPTTPAPAAPKPEQPTAPTDKPDNPAQPK